MNKLKELRLSKRSSKNPKKRMSMRELAEGSGVSLSTINRLENGGTAYEGTLLTLAEFFGVNVAVFKEAGMETINPKSDRLTRVDVQAVALTPGGPSVTRATRNPYSNL